MVQLAGACVSVAKVFHGGDSGGVALVAILRASSSFVVMMPEPISSQARLGRGFALLAKIASMASSTIDEAAYILAVFIDLRAAARGPKRIRLKISMYALLRGWPIDVLQMQHAESQVMRGRLSRKCVLSHELRCGGI
jgi:hypothetical protein